MKLINTAAELSPYRKVWDERLKVTPHASFFQSFEWTLVRWAHLAEDDESMHVLIVEDKAGGVVGFVPFCIKKRGLPVGNINFKKVRFPIDSWGSFYGPISNHPRRCLEAAAEFLSTIHVVDVDAIEFTLLPFSATSVNPKVQECSHVAVINLNNDFNHYWDSRKAQKNRRRNVERCNRRMAELGTLTYERWRGDESKDPRWDLYEICETLARKSWQSGLEEGFTLHHEQVSPFFKASHEAAVNVGGVDISILYLDEKPVAFAYGYHYQGYVDVSRIGYDPEHAKFSPGNLLWFRLIEDSFLRGDRVIDLGPSCLDYKRFWMTDLEASYQWFRYPSTLRAKSFQMARRARRVLPSSSDDHTNFEAKQLAGANVRRGNSKK